MDYDKSLIGDECLLDVIQQVLSEYPPPLDEAVEVEGLPTIRIADLCCGNGNFGLAVVSLFMKSHKIIVCFFPC